MTAAAATSPAASCWRRCASSRPATCRPSAWSAPGPAPWAIRSSCRRATWPTRWTATATAAAISGGSVPDALTSIAAYLAEAGWRADEPWGLEVALPDDFDYSLTGDTTRRSADDWAARGVSPRAGEALPALDEAALIAPAGARGPAFLVGHNFRVIRRYNNATSYALAVATLGDAIDGRPAVQGDWPREEPALKRTQVLELQRRLNARGHEVGEADGILGPNTRRGLRAFQREIGVTPDGFATLALLERLREVGS